jgi:hypothetical protein
MANWKLAAAIAAATTLSVPAFATEWWGVLDQHECMTVPAMSTALRAPGVMNTPEDMRHVLIKTGASVTPIRPAGTEGHAIVFDSTLRGNTEHMYFFDSKRMCEAVMVYNGYKSTR